MRNALVHLNYWSVLVVAVVGFLLGWLWYAVLFGKAWVAEMKITPEQIAAEKAKGGSGVYFLKGFLFTLISTWGLAMLIHAYGIPNWKHGAAVAAFIGVFMVAIRYFNLAGWEKKSVKLQAINGAHEIVLYAIQGAILGFWR